MQTKERWGDSERSSTSQSGRRRPNVGSIVFVILFILVVISVGLAVYFYRELSTYKEDPQKIIQEEVQAVVARVEQLMILPEGETPTLATVSDLTELKNQPFFAHAKIGDKVLLYANARKAILFDPVANKIVEVAPINIGNDNVATTPPNTSPPIEPGPAPAPEDRGTDEVVETQ